MEFRRSLTVPLRNANKKKNLYNHVIQRVRPSLSPISWHRKNKKQRYTDLIRDIINCLPFTLFIRLVLWAILTLGLFCVLFCVSWTPTNPFLALSHHILYCGGYDCLFWELSTIPCYPLSTKTNSKSFLTKQEMCSRSVMLNKERKESGTIIFHLNGE